MPAPTPPVLSLTCMDSSATMKRVVLVRLAARRMPAATQGGTRASHMPCKHAFEEGA